MHFTKLAVLLALPLLGLLASSARAGEPEAIEVEAPTTASTVEYFDLRIHDGQAFVAVPVLTEESDAWSKASSGGTEVPSRLDALRPDTFVVAGKTITPGAFVGYRTEGGASSLWWVIVFEASDAIAADGLAILGKVDSPDLRKPGLVALTSATGQEQLVAIRNVLDTKLSGADRRRLGKKVLSKSRVQIIPGTFPNDGTALVAINVPMKLEPAMTISAMFTITSDGEIATMLEAPGLHLESYTPVSLGDIDADGYDDVLFDTAYYEGGHTHLLRWPDAAASSAMIAGDGA